MCQIYNSTVTQMSACLLSLSVMSLLLPVCLRIPPGYPILADVSRRRSMLPGRTPEMQINTHSKLAVEQVL